MSYFGTTEWYLRVAQGKIAGHSIVSKFGAGALSSTMSPVAVGGFYRTPLSAG